jgi:hypothetical protein
MTYGALRAILLSEHALGQKAINLQSALSDIRIQEAIRTAFKTEEYLESIRKKAKTIIESANGIKNDSEEADSTLRESLTELQRRIQQAVEDTSLDEKVEKGDDRARLCSQQARAT